MCIRDRLSTVQLDYNLPERFNLEYVDPDDERQRPVVIHRAMLGSLERFLGVVIEHFGGAFPTWLAPIQVQIIPIADRHLSYADQLKSKLEGLNIRVDVDSRSERMNSKIRQAQLYKIPYMLIVGDKEQDQNGAAVRLRSGEDLGVLETSQICERIYGEVIARS